MEFSLHMGHSERLLAIIDVDDYQRQMWLVLCVDVGVALEAVCIWVKSNQLGFKYDFV